MATRTTSQAGDWSDTATWGGAAKPGIGDTAVVNHAVTVDENTTVGTSPSDETTMAITINGVVITIAADILLSVRGNIDSLGNTSSEIQMEAGSILEGDASNATTTSTTYQWKVSLLDANGETGNHCTIRSNAGGGNAYFEHDGAQATCRMQSDYIDFQRIGDSSNPAYHYYGWNSGGGHRLQHSTFDADCGAFTSFSAIGSAEDFTYVGNVHLQTGPSRCCDLHGVSGARTGVSAFTDNYFETKMNFDTFWEFDNFSGNVFKDGWSVASGGAYSATGAGANLFHGASQITATGDAVDWYVINTTASNPHFLNLSSNRNNSLTGLIFEHANSDGNGDCILVGSPGSTRTHALVGILILPGTGGSHSGSLISSLGNANNTYSIKNCTVWVSGTTGGIQVGETYNTHAGFLSSMKDNIFYRQSASGGYKIHNQDGGGGPTTDVVAAADADYNCGWNLDTGSEGKGYDTPMTGTPGANDVDEDPDFVDESRDAASWNAALGGAGTLADMFDEFALRNTGSFDTNYTVANLVAWVKEGFAPQNANLDGAGSDSGVIGAVAYAVAGGITKVVDEIVRY